MRDTSTTLFSCLLIASLLLHAVIYLRIADMCGNGGAGVIELSIEEPLAKPSARQIPRPRFRPEPPPLPKEIVRQPAEAKAVETVKSAAVEPPRVPLPTSLMAKIDIPESITAPVLSKADITPSPAVGSGGAYGAERDYFDMVRLKIESRKKYPRQAKAMRREGRVGVSFVIEPSGLIGDLAVEKSSGNSRLDRAALLAVRKSSPLPAPPRNLFTDARRVELTIAFELL